MRKVILLSLSILLICLGYSFADVPCKINYQGRLIKDNVPVNGTKTIVFSIYPVATGGSPIWTSGNVNVTVYNGLFRYVLDLSSINWAAGQELYLEVKVGSDILTPREPIYAYPYVINSHLLEGATKEYFLNTSGETQKKDGGLNIMGNLGVGTTSPGFKLQTYDATNPTIAATDSTTPVTTKMQSTDSAGWVGTHTNHPLYFFINNSATPRMAINTAGNVGIGTTSPTSLLHVAGVSCADTSFTLTGRAILGAGSGLSDTNLISNGYLSFTTGGSGEDVKIDSSGNVGIGTTSPTATLDVDGTVSIFGSWTTKDSLGSTLVKDATYRATTDGFVCVSIFCDITNNAYINAYTGPSSPPPSVLTQGLPEGYSRYAAVTLPVRKDDYWRILVLEGTPTIKWLPIGSGTCVKQ